MRLVALFSVVAVAFAAGLVDDPIVGDTVTYLDGSDWTASSPTVGAGGTTIPATVPGDLISDLFAAGQIGDPLFEINFQNSTIWDSHVWTYSKSFTASDDMLAAAANGGASDVLLVFDGIKMAGAVSVNGVPVGLAVDQFLRYVFPLAAAGVPLLKGEGANVITVEFNSSVVVNGRFMACTGGWDWAPYSVTAQWSPVGKANTFSKGLWKSVYLVTVTSTALTAVVPLTYYTGVFPVEPLTDGNHAPFLVAVRTHFWSPTAVKGTVTVSGAWGATNSSAVLLPAGESNVTLTLTAEASSVSLWWPVGMGGHPLYNVTSSFEPSSPGPSLSADRAIGFRVAALATGNDSAPGYVANHSNTDGTDQFSMHFRVNGAAVYARGANMIPMDELEGRYSADAHERLVTSATDAGMNMLRVWGGGVFLPNVWYDTCDKLGVMVYHDMQFAQQGHSPTQDTTQDAEFRHQIRRLSPHPSIVVYDGCNECTVIIGTPTGIYATFVLTVVAEEDNSRPLWPSCPAKGWLSGVNRLSSIPNGKPLIPAPTNYTELEGHGPYQHGGGFPCVNGNDDPSPFASMLPPSFKGYNSSIFLQSKFTSETGGVGMSSFESMSPLLLPDHWGLHGGMPPDECLDRGMSGFGTCKGNNPMSQRNYPCDNIVITYFGGNTTYLNATGESSFKQQLYHCMLGQALLLKSSMEDHRQYNTFGTMIWQLGEIWPTGGWGSLEYATPGVAGQVPGGRWKPLHYFLKNSAFTDVTASCGSDNSGVSKTDTLCFVKNDRSGLPFTGTVSVQALSFSTGTFTPLSQQSVSLPPGPAESLWFRFNQTFDPNTTVVDITVTDTAAGGAVICHNVVAFTTPQFFLLPPANVHFTVAPSPNPDGSIDISLSTDAVAAYVTLTTLAAGRFSDNAFFLVPPSATVQFIPFGPLDTSLLSSSLRLEHVAMYR